jgi:UDP:flavonoid glycosyltransferase YjiC (YdhE family)
MRVLMCSLESPGFLFPAIGLAKALAARGHEVAFVTDRSAESRLAQAGFERLPRGERDGRSFETGQWLRPLAVALQVQHVEHAMARFAPDLLVGQALTLGPLVVGERWGIPVASQGLATYLWHGAGQQLSGSAAAAERRRQRQRDMLRLWKEARAQARLPALAARLDEGALLGDLFLLRSVAELHGGPGLPGHLHLVGACLWEPAARNEELPAWIAAARRAGAPIAYVHHGRSFDGPLFWRAMVDAFGGGALRIAAGTGRLEPALERQVAAGAFHLRRDLDADGALRCADLMIGSATSSAVLGALSHGVPCLLIPHGGEQHDLAEQVERAGAGRILAAKMATPAALRRAVVEVLADASLRRGARELQLAFSRCDGFTLAVDLLEATAGAPRAAGADGPGCHRGLAAAIAPER